MQGLLDRQLALLTEVLKKGRIWALNIGENFNISLGAWETFTQVSRPHAHCYMPSPPENEDHHYLAAPNSLSN